MTEPFDFSSCQLLGYIVQKYRFISVGCSLLAVALLVVIVGCDRQSSVTVPFDESKAVHADLSGEKAFQHVQNLVNFGPRPSGSEALEESRGYIETELAKVGWKTERQTFEQSTVAGRYTFVNLRSRFGDAADNPVGLLCSHYDTKVFRFEFVGANDAGSSTGLLIEMARVLAQRPEIASKIELVFFDGEEAFGTNITDTDGLYGSRYYAKQLSKKPTKDRPKWGVLLDMVGDKDLNIEASIKVPGTPVQILKEQQQLPKTHQFDADMVGNRLNLIGKYLLDAASDIDMRSYVGLDSGYITDDHVPLNQIAGVPTIDIIDFDYGDYWHTPGDTMDKISAESLQISGQVSLRLIEKYLFTKF